MVRVLLVFLDLVAGDVPAAIAAGGGLLEAGVAVERAAAEGLLEAVLIFFRQVTGVAWER